MDSDTHDEITERAEESDQSKSAITRDLIRKGIEYDSVANERDELRNQLATTNARVDEHTELVRYVQSERSLAERRASAGVVTRVKWWFTGMPIDGWEE
ncbi:MAG: hypothetical protein QXG03_12940 [Halalkalicoccus sp.]